MVDLGTHSASGDVKLAWVKVAGEEPPSEGRTRAVTNYNSANRV